MAINRDQAFGLLCSYHGNFSNNWNEHTEYWGDEKPGITNDFGVFVEYVVGLIETGKDKELEVALKEIEDFIKFGDDEVQYGATIGFLEGITNVLLSRSPEQSKQFASLLKPKSKAFCIELDKFWGTQTPGVSGNA